MTLIMLSVVISVIISTYNEVNESPVSPEDFDAFCQLWVKFDFVGYFKHNNNNNGNNNIS